MALSAQFQETLIFFHLSSTFRGSKPSGSWMGLPEQRHCRGGSAAATIALVQGPEAAQSAMDVDRWRI